MKFVIISYVALGLVLSGAIGIEYNCAGIEIFPTYYGSPFVFKQNSLGSSMEHFYSISGLFLNTLTWSLVLYFIHNRIKRIKRTKSFIIGFKVIIGLLIAFSTLQIAMDSIMIGRGFDQNLNYWYWDIDQAAEDWGVTCEGELVTVKI